MEFRILVFAIFAATFFFSCEADSAQQKKPVKVNNPVTKKKRKKANNNQAKYWAFIKKNVRVSDKQIAELNAINRSYYKKTTALQKSKKWLGKSNLSTRKKIQSAKTAELKKILGTSWAKWTAANKNWKAINKKKKKKKK